MGSSAGEAARLLQAARLHLAQRQFHEAVDRATEIIRQDAKQTAAYLVRAEALRRLKRPDRALADLAVAIRLDPQQPAPYVIRAEILKRRNHFDQAIADATFALTIDPRNAAAFSIRAECRAAIGDEEGASDDVQEMLLIDPTRPVPNLQARTVSTNTDVERGAERFWKQSGGASQEGDRAAFADENPVDKTYRSRAAVSDEDAPEALGVASGYKPETIAKPIPRIRGGSSRSISNGGAALLGIGVVLAAVCALWIVFRGAPEPATSPKQDDPQSTRVAHTDIEAVAPVTSPKKADPLSSKVAHPEVEVATPVAALDEAAKKTKAAEKSLASIDPDTRRTFRSVPAIDLKALLEPRRHSVAGMWEDVEGGIISPDGGSVIKIPYEPPPEYRLTVKLLKGSKEMVGIGLVTRPSSVLITLDSYPDQGCVSKFDVVDGRGIVFHSGTRVLPLYESSTVVCTVHKNSVSVESNGLQIGRWDGDYRRLSVHPE
jgi:Tfp pilus assembly protein PilF